MSLDPDDEPTIPDIRLPPRPKSREDKTDKMSVGWRAVVVGLIVFTVFTPLATGFALHHDHASVRDLTVNDLAIRIDDAKKEWVDTHNRVYRLFDKRIEYLSRQNEILNNRLNDEIAARQNLVDLVLIKEKRPRYIKKTRKNLHNSTLNPF